MNNHHKKDTTTNFTSGPIAKPLITFALPLLFGNILQQLYSITDSIIVGNILGPDSLAAIGASAPVTRLSIAFTIGITLGLSVTVSQYFGAREYKKLQAAIATGFLFFFWISLFITICGALFSEPILKLMQTPAIILTEAAAYLRVTFYGTLFMIGYNVLNSLYRGLGNAYITLYLLVISTILNILLDVFFLVFLRFGVESTAWATIIAQGAAFFAACFLFNANYRQFSPKLTQLKFNTEILKTCLKIGVPSGIKGSMYWGGFVLLTALVNSFGAAAIAAFSLAGKIDSFLQTPLVSLQHALSSYTGQNVGARKAERIQAGVRTSLAIGTCFSLCMTIAVFFGAERILRLFTPDTAIIAEGARYLRCVSLFYVVYAFEEVIQGVAIGCGNTVILLVSTITAMWLVRLPLAYALAQPFGLTGIWLSIPSGWLIAVLFCNGYYISGMWKKKIAAQPD